MKSYYIRQGDKRQGPYSIEQLKQMQTIVSTANISLTNNEHLNYSAVKKSVLKKNRKTLGAITALLVTAFLIFKLQNKPIEFPNVDTTEAETVGQPVKPLVKPEKSVKEKKWMILQHILKQKQTGVKI